MIQEVRYTSALEAVHAARQAYPHRSDASLEDDRPVCHTSVLVEAVGFSAIHLFEGRQGPFVEVGGPTPKGYKLIDTERLPKPLMITNGYRAVPNIDKVVKAQRLPFKDNSIGALFAAGLPYGEHKLFPFGRFDLHKAFIGQAKRCLEESGVLVMDAATHDDVEYAVSSGLTPVQIVETTGTFRRQGNMVKTSYDFVAVKGQNPEVIYRWVQPTIAT